MPICFHDNNLVSGGGGEGVHLAVVRGRQTVSKFPNNECPREQDSAWFGHGDRLYQGGGHAGCWSFYTITQTGLKRPCTVPHSIHREP